MISSELQQLELGSSSVKVTRLPCMHCRVQRSLCSPCFAYRRGSSLLKGLSDAMPSLPSLEVATATGPVQQQQQVAAAPAARPLPTPLPS